jgi:hypothetical protein
VVLPLVVPVDCAMVAGGCAGERRLDTSLREDRTYLAGSCATKGGIIERCGPDASELQFASVADQGEAIVLHADRDDEGLAHFSPANFATFRSTNTSARLLPVLAWQNYGPCHHSPKFALIRAKRIGTKPVRAGTTHIKPLL